MNFPNLSALAVRERSVTLFFILLASALGVFAFLSLGRAEDPAFIVRVMVVTALWPGATAQQMQEQVADRLEKRAQEVDLLYRIETTARPGRVDLQIEFHDYTPGEDVPWHFYEVRRRMQDEAPQLPRGVIGPFINEDFSDVYFSLLSLSAPELPPRLVVREAERIRDRLRRIPGVRKAVVIGERPERIFVDFDTARLASLGVAPQAILDAIDAHNRLLPAGLVETRGPRVYLRLDADLADLADLRSVPVRAGERTFRLGDIATVRRGYEEPPAYLVRAGGQDAVILGLVTERGENGLAVGARLAEFLRAETARLPLGMTLAQLTNQADAIAKAVNLFQLKFLVAVAVVTFVSFLALGLRAGIVVAIAVPITLGLTFLLMKFSGMSLDRVTLGALILSLGLLVDDAIIAIEMMIVKMEEGWDRFRAAGHAWNVTAAPMLFGTLVTAAGFVPIGFARSAVGEYAGNMFWVLAYALVVSWFVAVTFTPYLGVMLLRAPRNGAHGEGMYRTAGYRRLRRLVRACVHWRKTTVAVTVAALAVAIAGMAGPVEKQFFPSSDRTEVLVSIFLPQGTSIAVTDAVTRRVEALIAPRPEVKSLSAYVGAGPPRFFMSLNPEMPNPAFAKIIVVTHGTGERDALMAALEEHIAAGEFPGARVRVHRLFYGPPSVWPVAFRVLGPDLTELRRIAGEVREVMAANPHAVHAHLDWNERVPVGRLAMDRERLRLIGLTPREVADQMQFHLDGVVVTEIREDIRTVEVRARGLREAAGGADLATLELKTGDGRKVALAQLGELRVDYEEPVLKRYNRQPVLAVQGDVRGAQPPDVTRAIWEALAPLRGRLPPDYHLEIWGDVEESAKADASIQKLQPVMAALMLVFIMLQMRSFSGTFMVLATAPLGIIGAVVALLVFRQAFGFVALLGLIGLAGILMRNTLILTQQVSDNFADGMSAADAVVEAAVRRARPVLLTALAAMLAFVPLATDSFWGPLAYTLIGGLAAGTLITLLFVPALYAMWFRLPPRDSGADADAAADGPDPLSAVP